jgi:hypothetical protein
MPEVAANRQPARGSVHAHPVRHGSGNMLNIGRGRFSGPVAPVAAKGGRVVRFAGGAVRPGQGGRIIGPRRVPRITAVSCAWR